MKTLFAAAFLAAASAAVPALAQDAGADRQTFDGFFGGVQLGWQQDQQSLSLTTAGLTSSATNRSDGLSYGGQVGYDFGLSPNFVAGLEVGITGRTGRTALDPDTSLGIGRTINVTGRLGYRVDADSLLYTRAGYANTQFRLTAPGGRASEDRGGWTIGAGYERYLTRTVSARVEYNYSDFGRDRLPFLAAGLGVDDATLKYRRHQIGVGVNFHF